MTDWNPAKAIFVMTSRMMYLLIFLIILISNVLACMCNISKIHLSWLTCLAPPSFCKCTCFTNSTIIPLSTHTEKSNRLDIRASSAGCSLCNRAFCLEQRLPICKDAEEKDVFTTCFQRDSRKDQIIVFTFIAATVGLLAWSFIKKILERRKNGAASSQSVGYAAVGNRWATAFENVRITLQATGSAIAQEIYHKERLGLQGMNRSFT